eukprot:Gb_40855 [translate_table: standard]
MQTTNGATGRFTLPPTHVIRHRAEQLELQEAKTFQIISASLSLLVELFDEVYAMLQPSIKDYEARKTLIAFVDKFAKLKIRGSSFNSSGPSIRAFGSYTMDLFTSGSDLDLSLNLGYTGDVFPRENKIPILKKLTKALYGLQGGGQIRGIQPILRAIVPVVKFVDCRSGIECDISIENKDGILKSELLHIFSSIDERFQKLCFLVKAWAKAHNINSSKDGTLNSLSIILLAAFHLQTRSPPILPPFSLFLEAGSSILEVEKRVQHFKYLYNRNHESVPELFITLLCKLLSVESLWKEGLCASTYEGSWISKTWDSKVGCINVEDFTNRSQNAARSVGKKECDIIYKCIRESLSHLKRHLTTKREAANLKMFLFDPHSKSKNASDQSLEANRQNSKKRSMPSQDVVNHKRMRHSEEVMKGRDSIVDKLPAIHSGSQASNFISRVAETVVRSTVPPVFRSAVTSGPRNDHWQERGWEARYGQQQDLGRIARYAQQQDPWPGVRYGQRQDQLLAPRYGQVHDLVHAVPHSNMNFAASQSQSAAINGLTHSYVSGQLQLGSLLSHLNHLEQNRGKPNVGFVGSYSTDWNLHHQSQNNLERLGRH